jgi:hypothetical protein
MSTETKEPNVLIGTLHVGDVPFSFFESFERLRKPRLWGWQGVSRTPTHHARNHVVNRVLQASPEKLAEKANTDAQREEVASRLSGVTHFFFMDDDMTFPEDALLRLLADDVPVVSGFYVRRFAPFKPVPMRRVGPEGYTELLSFCKGLQEVDVVGGGCLLIKREVLEAIPYPWFDYIDPAYRGKMITEDVPFCEKVQKAGFPILLDFDVHCGHLFNVPLGYGHWLQHKKFFDMKPTEPAQQKILAAAQDVRPYRPKKSRKTEGKKAIHAVDEREQSA